MSTTEIERKLRDNQGIGLTLVGNDDLNALLAELEALRSRCEEARQIIEGFAPLCEEGSRALRFLATARALQQGGKAE